jgi:hypothetical protein
MKITQELSLLINTSLYRSFTIYDTSIVKIWSKFKASLLKLASSNVTWRQLIKTKFATTICIIYIFYLNHAPHISRCVNKIGLSFNTLIFIFTYVSQIT